MNGKGSEVCIFLRPKVIKIEARSIVDIPEEEFTINYTSKALRYYDSITHIHRYRGWPVLSVTFNINIEFSHTKHLESPVTSSRDRGCDTVMLVYMIYAIRDKIGRAHV